MRILLNAPNASGSGNRNVTLAIVPAMAALSPQDDFIAFLPDEPDYLSLPSFDNLRIYWGQTNKLFRGFTRLIDFYWKVPRLCRQERVDVCFSLADLGPLQLEIPHIVLLHQAHLVYQETKLDYLWPLAARLRFHYMRWHFGRMVDNCQAVIVQTPVMAERTRHSYRLALDRVFAIPMAVPEHFSHHNHDLPISIAELVTYADKPYKLLFLANMGPHKNPAILVPLVHELKRRGLDKDVHIFLTADSKTGAGMPALLAKLATYDDVITNLGQIPPTQVAPTLMSSSALFLPTLLESFGLIYLEAMACGVPILTSDRDFAHWMCGEAAMYFDPLDPLSIADAIERFISADLQTLDRLRSAGRVRLLDFPNNWDSVARSYLDLIHTMVATEKHATD